MQLLALCTLAVGAACAFRLAPATPLRRPAASAAAPLRRGPAPLSAIRRGRGTYQPRRKDNGPPMNDLITQPELRVVMVVPDPEIPGKETEEQLGVIPRAEALSKAKEAGVDLVMINPNADPPVAKIVDYGKLKYAAEKKKKENAKNNKANEVKEIKMSYKIDTHDYDVRKKAAEKFLNAGNRIKVVIQFRGREQQHMDLGREMILRLRDDLDDITAAETPKVTREGNRLTTVIAPKPRQKGQQAK